jgi:hypothetical protein
MLKFALIYECGLFILDQTVSRSMFNIEHSADLSERAARSKGRSGFARMKTLTRSFPVVNILL